jgi:hypothetical protein
MGDESVLAVIPMTTDRHIARLRQERDRLRHALAVHGIRLDAKDRLWDRGRLMAPTRLRGRDARRYLELQRLTALLASDDGASSS